MQVEGNAAADRAWRVGAHAALSDPSRLAIVDHLGVGDFSPRALAHALGVSSNLLAHHLNVLEAAGLVRRLPSESDGRRTYVRLLPQALVRLGRLPIPAVPATRVVFVCSGNSARSQLAAAIWADRTGRPASSAGTKPAARIHPGARRVARAHGLRLLAERPAGVAEVLSPHDFVVTVCDSADQQVTRAHTHWSVPDPVRVGTAQAFEATLAELTSRIAAWVSPATQGAER